MRVELPPGARVGLPAASYGRIRQVVWMLLGELVVTEGDERSELAAGDCLAFGPPADATFANEIRRDLHLPRRRQPELSRGKSALRSGRSSPRPR